MKPKGVVYLVGAGPGDAKLLTLRGAELLARAEVVVHDAGVSPEVLRLAPSTAEFIRHPDAADGPAHSGPALPERLIARVRAGGSVVRLYAGDPYLFGEGGTFAMELAAARLPFEVVPGVPGIVAGPACVGIPLTQGGRSAGLAVVEDPVDAADAKTGIAWEPLARMPGTKVVLAQAGRVGEIAATLMAHGMDGSTPVALVERGATNRQKSVIGTLATIRDSTVQSGLTASVVAVVGGVVQLQTKLNWFEKRPLFGQRVVVTRSREQAEPLAQSLAELGAEILRVPTIKIAPPTQLDDLKDALLGLNAYEWLVFTSANGVTAFFDWFFKGFDDLRDIGGVRIAAVGPGTAAKLREFHLKVDLMPEEYLGTAVADAFVKYQSIENVSICLMRAEAADSDLPKALKTLGAIVDDVACYRTVPEVEDPTGAAARLQEAGAEWITFTSGSTVENFHARFDLPGLMKRFPQIRTASIGPETSSALTALGLKPTVQAKPHTVAGLVQAITAHEAAHHRS